MTGKQLRNALLQWAIEGRLVPQCADDEPASVLLQRIRDEKARLVKAGKLKRDKHETIIYRGDDNSHYEKLSDGSVRCIDYELPFEIPESWCWVRVRHIGLVTTGSTPPTHDSSLYGNDYPFFKPTDLNQGYETIFSSDSVSKKGYSNSRQVHNGDVLVTCIGATIGKTGLIKRDGICNQQINAISPSFSCKSEYLYIACISPCFQGQIMSNASSTTLPILNKQKFEQLLIPLPPLAEQGRIVAKLEELMPVVERYEKAQVELEKLNADIRPLLKKSILQEAIQGRLVEQDPADEPAAVLLDRIRREKQALVKQGRLKAKDITDSTIYRTDDNRHYEKRGKETVDITDSIPFGIPDSWQWVRLKDIVQFNPKNNSDDDTMAAFIPMEKICAGYKSSFTFENRRWKDIRTGFTHFADGDVAFAKITPCFQNRKSMVLHDLPNGIGAGTTELKVMRPYSSTLNTMYLLYFVESAYFVDEATFKGTANQQRILSGYAENKLFSLPPLAEQQRIVEKVESLFQHLQ